MSDEVFDRETTARQRPFVVSLAAVYEFLKAIYLLIVFRSIWTLHGASLGPAMSDNLENVGLLVIFAAMVLMVVLGLGLWNLQSWARHALLVPLAGYGYLWWRGVLGIKGSLFWGLQDDVLRAFVPAWALNGVVVLDLAVVLTLLFYPDIAKAFNDKEIGLLDL